MNSNLSTVLVTVTDYVTIYPTLDSVLTSGKSSTMATQPTSAAMSSGLTSSVKSLESFPIVAQPTLVGTTGQTFATSFRSTLQTSVRSSPGEEVTLPQAVYSRGIRIVAQPRTSQSPYEQEPDHDDYHENLVDRVFNVVTTDVPPKTARVPSWRMSTRQSASTASIVSTATIESMESMGPTASIASTTSKRLRDLTVEQNRSQALFDLSQWEDSISVKQNRSEAPFDLTQWDDGFEEVRKSFWERSLAVVGLPNYGRPPGVKRDKNTNFAGKSKLQTSLPTTEDTGAATAAEICPLRVRNGRDESLHPQHGDVSSSDARAPPRANTDGEFITVALDSPILGMSNEEMKEAKLAGERRCMEKRRTDGYGMFERLKSVLPDGMDGQGLQNPYRW
ncbi:hypothetical protein GRF29_185g1473429 [Pseudopithomyces chartarum]|uniref:Uncharacterized protein n=1 Tax=Pseudopithomyces chartarum TaxID=1892770 RepID=A0AAN6LQK6_9PLEO|nr:hypothetical protein GRF29_185g1473429 [Pseudopithomyces chartarum]